MTRHNILPQALAELEEATIWYENQEQGLGLDLLNDYRAYLDQALTTKGLGSLIGSIQDGTVIRRYRLPRFDRYAIIMTTIRRTPTVIAFEHSSRKPKHWDERIE